MSETNFTDNNAIIFAKADKFKNRFYQFRDERLLPPKRAMAALVFTRFADLRMTHQRLNTILDKMEQLFNTGQFVKAGALIEELRISESMFAEPETLADLASVYFLMPGEDPFEYSREWATKKKELWNQDSDAKAFFLHRAYMQTSLYSANSSLNLTEYFNGISQVLKRFNRFDIGSTKNTTLDRLTSSMSPPES